MNVNVNVSVSVNVNVIKIERQKNVIGLLSLQCPWLTVMYT